jgi:MATE family multidrug resistance protein
VLLVCTGAIYIGRLGSLPLSASVLANSVYNCTGLSLALGLSAGMETLCGQVRVWGAAVARMMDDGRSWARVGPWTCC